MAITAYEIVDGQHVAVPEPGATSPSNGAQESAPDANGTGVLGATDPPRPGAGQPPASPAGTPPPGEGESPGESDDDDSPLQDDSEVNAERLNKRFAYLTRKRREAERQVAQERQQHALELAQLRGQQEATQRLLSGAAPELPPTPPQPTGPPQAEQFASHEDYVLAAARYGAQQEFQQRDQQMQALRQQDQQRQFQQDLMTREQAFQAEHPDFDTVVRAGLAGKVSPILQQALMLVPDGPAVAYKLAQEGATIVDANGQTLLHRLNSLPPPLVLVELGRLLPPPTTTQPPAVGQTNGHAALPAPPTPLSGSGAGAPTGQYTDTMSQQKYRAWRARTSQDPRWKAS